jgi:putative SOS response-associated peptidase YedK
MCNRYQPPRLDVIEDLFAVKPYLDAPEYGAMYPRSVGPFIRAAESGHRELVFGQWALLPWFAKSRVLKYSTNNARAEELNEKASYKGPWQRGQRCVIPAEHFDEPNWETGKNVWHRFWRADGLPWALAGLWNTWTDKTSGELVESFTMLTLNADAHPLMSRMHKPDPRLPANAQDKRSVVPLPMEVLDTWLWGSPEEARALLRVPPEEHFQVRALAPQPARSASAPTG